jgi:hypothetical protein
MAVHPFSLSLQGHVLIGSDYRKLTRFAWRVAHPGLDQLLKPTSAKAQENVPNPKLFLGR